MKINFKLWISIYLVFTYFNDIINNKNFNKKVSEQKIILTVRYNFKLPTKMLSFIFFQTLY